jgi:Uma2 family endonuclease
MSDALKTPPPTRFLQDRPGWIPTHITQDWDPNPYAYQTEEELMPAGGLHGQLLAYLMELLRAPLKARGLMLLMDTFMLYRDPQGVKQRVAPDLLLMPFGFPPPSAYDLDTQPPPQCVVEVTSPKSHLKDLVNQVPFYLGLGIPTYLAIDAITPRSRLREQIELHLWRQRQGQARQVAADSEGRLALPEMGLKVQAEEQRIRLLDLVSGQFLRDSEQLNTALQQTEQALQATEQSLRTTEQSLRVTEQTLQVTDQAYRTATQRAEVEAEAHRAAEIEIARLKALLAQKGQDG